jgi:hypothetical protein
MADTPDFLDIQPESGTAAEPEHPPVETQPQPAAQTEAAPGKPDVTFMGNSYDLSAVVGLTTGAIVLLSCLTCNLGFYCLPFVPMVLGVVGLLAAKDAVNPERTRLLSWLSVGSGALILLLIAVFVVLYLGFIVFVIAAENGGF